MTDFHEIDGPLLAFGGVCSNLQALEAMLAFAARRGVDPAQMVCTGDIVAYGADGDACLDLIQSAGIMTIAGNCERQLALAEADCGCGFAPGSVGDDLAQRWFAHACGQADPARRAFMGGLPDFLEIAINGLRLRVIHGGVSQINRFIFASTPERIKARELDAAGVDGVIAGHCGLPFTQSVGGRLWHNPGSLGLPANDGSPRVWCSILSAGSQPRTLHIEHVALEYDHGAAARQMRGAALPEDYARALETGLWPDCGVLPAIEARAAGKALRTGSVGWRAGDEAPLAWPSPSHRAGVAAGKFVDPHITATGERRAQVALGGLETLWINTGTLCNLSCQSCYIESTPRNDRLAYISTDDVRGYLDEIARDRLPTRTIGITGGEPFMNPHIIDILDLSLERGFEALVLTNAMKPMRLRQRRLEDLHARYGDRLTIRVSLDHYSQDLHELERGPRSWAPAIEGLQWLARSGFRLHVAGRMYSGEAEAVARAGYARLFASLGVSIDASDPVELVLFPEMDEQADVPEITESCWNILGMQPSEVMCASSRMVVRRKGAEGPAVLACTLLAYDPRFELGRTLKEASQPVALNHPHCAKFCVLGGASCSR